MLRVWLDLLGLLWPNRLPGGRGSVGGGPKLAAAIGGVLFVLGDFSALEHAVTNPIVVVEVLENPVPGGLFALLAGGEAHLGEIGVRIHGLEDTLEEVSVVTGDETVDAVFNKKLGAAAACHDGGNTGGVRFLNHIAEGIGVRWE